MKKFLTSFTMLVSLSMVLMIPAFADSKTDTTNMDGVNNYKTYKSYMSKGNTVKPISPSGALSTQPGMGVLNNGVTSLNNMTNTPNRSIYPTTNNNYTPNSIYTPNTNSYMNNGTYTPNTNNYMNNGTYTPGTYTPKSTYGTYDSTRMNTYRTHNSTIVPRATTYRAAATTTKSGFSWGWLGLLGLFGLAGMRSKSRDDIR